MIDNSKEMDCLNCICQTCANFYLCTYHLACKDGNNNAITVTKDKGCKDYIEDEE